MKRALWAFVAGTCLSACGGGGNPLPTGPSPVSTTVEFTFTASLSGSALDCAGQAYLFPSWWGFAPVTMDAISTDQFRLLFDQVPIGHQSVRLAAPEGCGFESLTANGVALRSIDDAFPFTAHPDGSVAP